MSYAQLPKSISHSSASSEKPSSSDVDSLQQAESLLSQNILKAEEAGDIENVEYNTFLLGQLYFENGLLEKAFGQFGRIDFTSKSIFAKQAQYQYAILLFDASDQLNLEKSEQVKFSKNAFQQLEMLEKSLARDSLFYVCANYNLGLATFNGKNTNIKTFDILPTAIAYWEKSAGGDEKEISSPKNVKAMDIFCAGPSVTLNYDNELQFYRSLAQSRLGQVFSFDSDFQDHEKSFFWHTEAASNGNLESQGAIGVMYLEGLGCKRNEKAGMYCLKQAAGSNNIYALGRLVEYYYKKKIYGHCIETAKPFTMKFLLDSEENIKRDLIKSAQQIHCEPSYALKGAVLCAFYFARCYESGLVEKINSKSNIISNLPTTEARKSLKFEQNQSDNIMHEIKDCHLKLYRACARLDSGLVSDLQAQRTYALV